jgi:hypothetical protein
MRGNRKVSFLVADTDKVATLIPHSEIICGEHAAHWVSMEKSMQVNEALATFVAQ